MAQREQGWPEPQPQTQGRGTRDSKFSEVTDWTAKLRDRVGPRRTHSFSFSKLNVYSHLSLGRGKHEVSEAKLHRFWRRRNNKDSSEYTEFVEQGTYRWARHMG